MSNGFENILEIRKARDSFPAFVKYMTKDSPDPYFDEAWHSILDEKLEAAEKGDKRQLVIVSLPPRSGKTDRVGRYFPAWFHGKNRQRSLIYVGHSKEFSEKIGNDTLRIMQTEKYNDVFPHYRLKSERGNLITSADGGMMLYTGRGGQTTGLGGHILISDDLFASSKQADSKRTRDDIWNFFNDDFSTRVMNEKSSIFVIMTRRHEDDVVGRIIEPDNDFYVKELADEWTYIKIPALATENNDVIGRKLGESISPNRFSVSYFRNKQLENPVGFSTIYQQDPTPDEGDLFKKENILRYDESPSKKAEGLEIYGFSDHAVTENQRSDKTCLLIAGKDSEGRIFILDTVWKVMGPDTAVKEMVRLMKKWNPVVWYAERGHIIHTLHPLIRDAMLSANVYCKIVLIQPKGKKVQRAQSIIGMVSMERVFFPKGLGWVNLAIEEMTKFPHGSNDDFVDAMSLVGLKFHRMRGAIGKAIDEKPIKKGSFADLKKQQKKSATINFAGNIY